MSYSISAFFWFGLMIWNLHRYKSRAYCNEIISMSTCYIGWISGEISFNKIIKKCILHPFFGKFIPTQGWRTLCLVINYHYIYDQFCQSIWLNGIHHLGTFLYSVISLVWEHVLSLKFSSLFLLLLFTPTIQIGKNRSTNLEYKINKIYSKPFVA